MDTRDDTNAHQVGHGYAMTYAKEIIHNFTCIFCNRNWSIELPPGADHNILNKELYCPWCGQQHAYLTDDELK